MTPPTAMDSQLVAPSGRWSVTLVSVGVTASSFLFLTDWASVS
jgi:hypothetical protein